MNIDRKNYVWAGLFFGFPMGLVYFWITGSLYLSIFLGILSGFFFWGVIVIFLNSKTIQKTSQIELHEDGDVIKEGLANHFVYTEAVGGRLVLTKEALLFKSHALNVQQHELKLLLKDIQEVKATKNWFIFPNGLTVKLKGGDTTYRFVVNNHKDWQEKVMTCLPR